MWRPDENMGRRVLFVGRLRIAVVSCVATNPCTFSLRKGSAPERTASWITTMRFFCLALDYAKLVNKRKSDLTPPNITKRKNHERYIRSLREQQPDDG